jgi:hypothetical protein
MAKGVIGGVWHQATISQSLRAAISLNISIFNDSSNIAPQAHINLRAYKQTSITPHASAQTLSSDSVKNENGVASGENGGENGGSGNGQRRNVAARRSRHRIHRAALRRNAALMATRAAGARTLQRTGGSALLRARIDRHSRGGARITAYSVAECARSIGQCINGAALRARSCSFARAASSRGALAYQDGGVVGIGESSIRGVDENESQQIIGGIEAAASASKKNSSASK